MAMFAGKQMVVILGVFVLSVSWSGKMRREEVRRSRKLEMRREREELRRGRWEMGREREEKRSAGWGNLRKWREREAQKSWG